MSGDSRSPDPFGFTPDTRAYVPREATERVLADLVTRLLRGPTAIAIVGPVGVGKTLLLHLLAERMGPAVHSVYLPNPRFAPDEICAWIAHAAGAPSGEEAQPLLRAWLEHLREQEQACLLLIDDADALPDATARWLAQLVADARGGLRIAMAALEGPTSVRVLRRFEGLHRVELAASMSLEETAAYVGWRLHRADVPEDVRARFDEAAVAEIHRVAHGSPRRLHLAVEALVRSGNVAVLEDEIAAFADHPMAPRPSSTAPETTRRAAAAAERAEPAEPAEPEAPTAPPRRSPLGPILVAAGAVAVVALLVHRDPAAPPPSADGARVPDAASLGPDPEGGPAPESAEAAGEPSADALSVNVNATPWARIEIDGVDVGETPLAGIPLRPGPHTFRAQLPDGRVLERSVEIDPDHRHVAFD